MNEPVAVDPQIAADQPPAGAESLVGRTVAAVIGLIKDGDLRPGDPLPAENNLANRLDVSRIVVREANRSLAALGIVQLSNGRAPRVSLPDENVIGLLLDHVVHTRHVTVQQVLDVRRALEVRAVALAAVRRTEAEADQILFHAAGMREAGDDTIRVRDHDVAMHAAIADAARNPLFSIMIKAFAPITRQTWPVGWTSRGEQEERCKMIAQHEAVAHAIKEQDVAAARQAMSEHFDDTVRVLIGAGVT